MAIPDSLSAWREFVGYTPTAPDVLTASELSGLPP